MGVETIPSNPDTAVLVACAHGLTEVASTLIEQNPQADSRSLVLLIVACACGHTATASMLLAKGAALNLNASNGMTPLIAACKNGRVETASMLCSTGAMIDQTTHKGMTALSIACRQGHFKTVLVLLKLGAAVDKQDDGGVTPLHRACHAGHTRIASLLLAYGAAINHVAASGATALIMACLRNHTETASILMSEGAEINQPAGPGITPMLAACHQGNLATVQLLSSHGAQRVYGYGNAYSVAIKRGHDDVVDWLIKSMQWTSRLHHLEIIDHERARFLLRSGADLHLSEDGGPTPLELAQEHLQSVRNAATGSAAQLVLQAAAPWCQQTHELFPKKARAYAVELMLIGHRLSQQKRFFRHEGAIFDAWMFYVMPKALDRGDF
jgi:ankyrin repeat protein